MDRIESGSELERAARRPPRGGLIGEFWYFVRHNRKWWLIPLLIPVLVLGGLMLLAGTGAAPFIYTLF
jgi:hypothetical protein